MSTYHAPMGASDAPQRCRRDPRPLGGVEIGGIRNAKHNRTWGL